MISVLYISNRYGGLDILRANLKRQTFKDFELVFVDGLYNERKNEVSEYFKDFKVTHIDQNVLPMEGFVSRLARADNLGFRNCKGELIVCLQDYIYIPSTGLEKFWNLHKLEEGKALITGMGHQYFYPAKEDIVNDKGLITVFEQDYTKKPETPHWLDPRFDGNYSVRLAHPVEWELNWACIPKDIIFKIGGMDEVYDQKGFAWDNTNIATRCAMLGFKILIDPSNECFGFDHDGWWVNPLKAQRISPQEYHFEIITKMQNGEVSPVLNYLS